MKFYGYYGDKAVKDTMILGAQTQRRVQLNKAGLGAPKVATNPRPPSVCVACPKVALYQDQLYGGLGYCADHKHLLQRSLVEKVRSYDTKSGAITKAKDERQKEVDMSRKHKKVVKDRKGFRN